ncbi:MAG: peptidoglycan-binding domain-containing protein [Candidatus Parcubacteria bacterium]|nr:peptidoglycan-binding domain-containing protein [Candidatus Parcubacteria bacterium]
MIKAGKKNLILAAFGVLFFALPFFVFAYSSGTQSKFYLEQDFDKQGRESAYATIRNTSANAYFYVENQWWESLSTDEKESLNKKIIDLGNHFDSEIYPKMTDTFGNEWRPGIDGDYKITILFHEMKNDAAGYFRTIDEYPTIQAPGSNEREMIYVNTEAFDYSYPESYIAHEFMHLITFNQKNRQAGKDEEVWLNELRAEYVPTLLGYDKEYTGSNLQKRIRNFIDSPNDSLTEWKGEVSDYGVISMFGQYLVEHYGLNILRDSLSSSSVGLVSLDYALAKNNVKKNIAEVFTDWTIGISANDCTLGNQYCYNNEFLKTIKVAPSLIYLPPTQESHLSLIYTIKEWSGNWYKIVGGDKGLKLKFSGLTSKSFIVPYLIERSNKIQSINFLEVDKDDSGNIELPLFGENNQSLILLPVIEKKVSDFSDNEPYWRFSLDVSTFDNGNNGTDNVGETIPISQMTIVELRAKILEVQNIIAQLLIELQNLKGETVDCSRINNNLFFGLVNNSEVRCLQEFLKNQGIDIYPEGLITGNFYSATKQAVVRFQEKYANEILFPLGYQGGTGFVGASTRDKINQLLAK